LEQLVRQVFKDSKVFRGFKDNRESKVIQGLKEWMGLKEFQDLQEPMDRLDRRVFKVFRVLKVLQVQRAGQGIQVHQDLPRIQAQLDGLEIQDRQVPQGGLGIQAILGLQVQQVQRAGRGIQVLLDRLDLEQPVLQEVEGV
jgi:hypothetical protein